MGGGEVSVGGPLALLSLRPWPLFSLPALPSCDGPCLGLWDGSSAHLVAQARPVGLTPGLYHPSQPSAHQVYWGDRKCGEPHPASGGLPASAVALQAFLSAMGGGSWHVLESDHVSVLVSRLRIFLSHGKAKSSVTGPRAS